MTEPDYVAIEVAGRLISVPARTLRRWAEAGKVPVVAGHRKRLVRLDDVRRTAAMTGHDAATPDMTEGSASQPSGHVAGAGADDAVPRPSVAVSPAARSQLEAIRDEWLQPLIDQLGEAQRTIGRREAERDQATRERDALRDELRQLRHAPQDRDPGPLQGVVVAETSETLQPPAVPESALRRWWWKV